MTRHMYLPTAAKYLPRPRSYGFGGGGGVHDQSKPRPRSAKPRKKPRRAILMVSAMSFLLVVAADIIPHIDIAPKWAELKNMKKYYFSSCGDNHLLIHYPRNARKGGAKNDRKNDNAKPTEKDKGPYRRLRR